MAHPAPLLTHYLRTGYNGQPHAPANPALDRLLAQLDHPHPCNVLHRVPRG